ncbi:MAG: hypothetical protein AWM53_00171 [Candidatus Dichloromethanomonas elyunquensis]|nr:MAG: hypothetical protein AWM53_00171 [Candidatus Dichloromethanomonas elyunquensis]
MKKFKVLKVLITIIMVILGISCISWFTWNLGKIFLGMVSAGTSETKAKADQSGSVILNLPKVDFWTCQIGVYKDKKKADILVSSLKLEGRKAEIIKEEPYTVALGVFNNKEEAVRQGNILAQEGIQTWIKEETFPALHYKVSGNNIGKITSLLMIANSILNGAERDQVKQEQAGDVQSYFAGQCPQDFQNLKAMLQEILFREFPNKESDNLDRRDLLGLYAEYKSITTKYINISK